MTQMTGVTVASGTVNASGSNAGYNLASGFGERRYTVHVSFPREFSSVPDVTVSLSKIDEDKGANTRVWVYAEGVTRAGFDLVFMTWYDSITYQLSASWIAVGQ